MRDCPVCKAFVDGPTCQQCGYGAPKAAKSAPVNPDWWRCADVDREGSRCAKPGPLTESTRGSDRWYCYQHYPPFRSRGYARSEPPAGWKNAVHKPNARQIASIAEDLLERQAIQGEGS